MKRFVYPADSLNELYQWRTSSIDMCALSMPRERYNAPYIRYPLEEIGRTGFHKVEFSDYHVSIIEEGNLAKTNLCMAHLCHDTLRLGSTNAHRETAITAIELLVWGVGLLRHVVPAEFGLRKYLGEPFPGKIDSKFSEVCSLMIIQGINDRVMVPVAWESTNIVLGDSYGEMEQLMRRREEKRFLRSYRDQLEWITEMITGKDWYPPVLMVFPRGLSHIGGEHLQLHENHRTNNNLWDQAPGSVDEMLERAEFLLENTVIDRKPVNGVYSTARLKLV